MKLSAAVLLLLAAPLFVAGSPCWKDAYGRGAGKLITSCKAAHEKNGALCYPPCKAGYEGSAGICWR